MSEVGVILREVADREDAVRIRRRAKRADRPKRHHSDMYRLQARAYHDDLAEVATKQPA